MGAVTKGLILGMATATETDRGTPAETEWASFLIDDLEVALDAN